MCVSPAHFAGQMAALARLARPMCLEALLVAASAGCLPDRAVAVTFDDGYRDVLQAAQPILSQWAIPATLFVTSGRLNIPLWWDELERLILGASALPAELDLRLGPLTMRWRANGQPSQVARRDLLRKLHRLFLKLPDEPERGLAQLRLWSGDDGGPTRLTLTEPELAHLAADSLFTIGSHGLSHRPLGHLPLDEAEQEIAQSKLALEAITGRAIRSFAYPHGSAGDSTRHLLIESGYSLACASHNGVVSRASDSYALPRFWPPNVDGETFARWLRRWL
jgi:peptidoglycan/xylan/chitin deacetylase (PgdA/CDA1 family)